MHFAHAHGGSPVHPFIAFEGLQTIKDRSHLDYHGITVRRWMDAWGVEGTNVTFGDGLCGRRLEQPGFSCGLSLVLRSMTKDLLVFAFRFNDT